MRIQIVAEFFLEYVEEQAGALRRAGHEVGLLCRDHAFEFGGREQDRRAVLRRMIDAGVQITELPGRFSDIRRVGHAVRLRTQLLDRRPDVVHGHDPFDPHLLAVVAGLPRVVTVHDPTPHPGVQGLGVGPGLVNRAWRRGAELIVHSSGLREELRTVHPRSHISVIPLGTTPLDAPLPPPHRPAVLLFGKLLAYKGVDVLVDAMRIVWAARPDIDLIIAGAGPEAERIPDHPRIITHIGHIPQQEVSALFARASLLALPYTQASQSGVGLMALARGIPVVVSDVGALSMLADDPSCVVPPRDRDALAAAILETLDHDQRRRERVMDRTWKEFSWDALMPANFEVYEAAIRNARSPRP